MCMQHAREGIEDGHAGLSTLLAASGAAAAGINAWLHAQDIEVNERERSGGASAGHVTGRLPIGGGGLEELPRLLC